MENKLLCKVIMLPTEKNSRLFLRRGELEYAAIGAELAHEPPQWLTQHLYLVSDGSGRLKKDQWGISASPGGYNLFKSSGDVAHNTRDADYFKVEATTDRSLGLPLIPQWFIEEYILKQGEIDKVYISFKEYYQIPDCYDEQQWREEEHSTKQEYLKRDIIILPVKDSWNREEHRKGIIEGINWYRNWIRPDKPFKLDPQSEEFNNWFDKNY